MAEPVAIAGRLLPHMVTIEPHTGQSAYGDTWGPGVQVRAFVDQGRRVVRDKDGSQVVSETTVYAPPGTVCPPRSRVTLPDGSQTLVILARPRDTGGRSRLDHLQVACE